MALTPQEIEKKEFVPAWRGYDRREVREFLRLVAAEHRALVERLSPGVIDLRSAGTSRGRGSPAADVTDLPGLLRQLARVVERLNTEHGGELHRRASHRHVS